MNCGTTTRMGLLVTVVYAVTENGYVFLTVIYDDGKLQKKMDQVYGPKIVAVESALRPAI